MSNDVSCLNIQNSLQLKIQSCEQFFVSRYYEICFYLVAHCLLHVDDGIAGCPSPPWTVWTTTAHAAHWLSTHHELELKFEIFRMQFFVGKPTASFTDQMRQPAPAPTCCDRRLLQAACARPSIPRAAPPPGQAITTASYCLQKLTAICGPCCCAWSGCLCRQASTMSTIRTREDGPSATKARHPLPPCTYLELSFTLVQPTAGSRQPWLMNNAQPFPLG